MLIMPSFKKSLIVEQFQGNYLKRKHRGVVPVQGPRSRISKTSHLKLKREVSDGKKVQDFHYVSGRRRRFREERNGFVKAGVVK